MSKKFWKWSNAVESNDSELILDGPISDMTWWGDEVIPQQFREELKQHKGDLTVVLNSPGGDVFAGMSIYNALREFEAHVTVRIDGLAASIASVIAMAGDKVVMSPGTMMMIHKPWTMAVGDANELDKVKEVLNSIEDSIIPIYTSRSGLSKDEVIEMLEAETWMTAEEAVEFGFADEYIEAKKKVSISDMFKNAINGEFAYNMSVMEAPLKDLADKLRAQVDTDVPSEETDDIATTTEAVDETVSVQTDAPEESKDEPEAKETTEVNNNVREDTTMADNKDIAKNQVIEPKNQATPEIKVTAGDYLKSEKSLEKFALVLAQHAGGTTQEVKEAWANHLKVDMGITNPDVLLPGAVVQAIEDAFKEGGEIWNLVNKTGLDVYKVAWDTVTGENSRAKGYNRDEEETKAEEVITLEDRTIRPQFIYKYLTLPKEVIKENRSTGALLRYVLSELPRRIVREVERAIVIGDGRTPGTDYAISSFTSLKSDAQAYNVFAQVYDPAPSENAYASLLRARALVKAEGAKYLIAKPDFVTDVLLLQSVNGGYLFTPGTSIANVFGFAGVITPDWFDDSTDADMDAYIFTPSNYLTVGDNSIESFSNFLLSTNKNEYLQEIWAGGALGAMNSAVGISSNPSS